MLKSATWNSVLTKWFNKSRDKQGLEVGGVTDVQAGGVFGAGFRRETTSGARAGWLGGQGAGSLASHERGEGAEPVLRTSVHEI